jgi:hypothetical protein
LIDQGGGKRRAGKCRTGKKSDAFSVPRNSAASYFVERSAKLFDKGTRRRQIGKAPTIIAFGKVLENFANADRGSIFPCRR